MAIGIKMATIKSQKSVLKSSFVHIIRVFEVS